MATALATAGAFPVATAYIYRSPLAARPVTTAPGHKGLTRAEARFAQSAPVASSLVFPAPSAGAAHSAPSSSCGPAPLAKVEHSAPIARRVRGTAGAELLAPQAVTDECGLRRTRRGVERGFRPVPRLPSSMSFASAVAQLLQTRLRRGFVAG